jgi:hypothetical protein
MATATLALANPSEGNEWTVTISGTNLLTTSQVNSDASYSTGTVGADVSVTAPINLGVIFSMPTTTQTESFQTYGGQYATWRSSTAITGLSNSQYPTTGFSLDIWGNNAGDNTDVIFRINQNVTWTTIAGSYQLNSNKYSLIYSYTSSHAPIFSKGGTLTISVA